MHFFLMGRPDRSRSERLRWGLDAGADTIGRHLQHRHQVRLSQSTVHQILTRHAAVTPDPGKRPRSSYLRFYRGTAE
jgi:hypothetical protein